MATILDPFIPPSGQFHGARMGLASAFETEETSVGTVVELGRNGENRIYAIALPASITAERPAA